uniref:Uncharacterized protein n=1 Tax=Nelumbo nucifera TaxID=4432 RepID=A0A822YSW6_NELNU|nr:TPA_asm: hypothetical protein HUJ06_006382 [Nelumbo nucifera]
MYTFVGNFLAWNVSSTVKTWRSMKNPLSNPSSQTEKIGLAVSILRIKEHSNPRPFSLSPVSSSLSLSLHSLSAHCPFMFIAPNIKCKTPNLFPFSLCITVSFILLLLVYILVSTIYMDVGVLLFEFDL